MTARTLEMHDIVDAPIGASFTSGRDTFQKVNADEWRVSHLDAHGWEVAHLWGESDVWDIVRDDQIEALIIPAKRVKADPLQLRLRLVKVSA